MLVVVSMYALFEHLLCPGNDDKPLKNVTIGSMSHDDLPVSGGQNYILVLKIFSLVLFILPCLRYIFF